MGTAGRPARTTDPRLFVAGMVGAGIMTVTSCNATVNPGPDARVLNTVPLLGFDIFLPVGLILLGFFFYRWLTSPPSRPDRP